MLAVLQSYGINVSRGSAPFLALNALAVEVQRLQDRVWSALENAFVSTADAVYLPRHAGMFDVVRQPAKKATTNLVFTATNGTVIPAGTEATTQATRSQGVLSPSIAYRTLAAATASGGQAVVGVEAVEVGSRANVAANTIVLLTVDVPGVTSVTNPEPVTDGADIQDIELWRSDVLQFMQSRRAGGNVDDHLVWALRIPGVESASVLALSDGRAVTVTADEVPGHVAVFLVGSNGLPASEAVVDLALMTNVDPYVRPVEPETLALAGTGAAIGTLPASAEPAVVFGPHATNGTATHDNLETFLPRAGVWQVRWRAQVSQNANLGNLLRVGVYDDTAIAWAKRRPDATGPDSLVVYQADDIPAAGGWEVLDFYWNGTNALRFEFMRLGATDHTGSDQTTTVYLDEVIYRSAFSSPLGLGVVPIGQRVTYLPAIAIPVVVGVTVAVEPGTDIVAMKAAIHAALVGHFQGLALGVRRTVRHAALVALLFSLPRVTNVLGVTLNGATSDVAVGATAVPVLVPSDPTVSEEGGGALGFGQQALLPPTWPTLDSNAP